MANITISNGRVNHSRITRQTNSIGINTGVERQLTAIDRIVTHHTVSGNMPTIQNVNNWWNANGWNRAGYHFLVRNDGSIWQLVPIHAPSWGAGAQANPRSIHISIAGNFTANNLPSRAAQESYAWLVNQLLNSSALPNLRHDSQVTRHSDWMATACSGFTLAQARSWVVNARQTATPPAGGNTHTVRSGETLSGIALKHRTTVAELTRLNNIANANLIRVGQVLRLPTASNSTPAPTPAPQPTIRVGSRVRVNSNARTWATGENIASFVHGQTYTVQQLRNSNNELLLAGVMSWIRRSDVTVI